MLEHDMKPLTPAQIFGHIRNLVFCVAIAIWLVQFGPMVDPVWKPESGEPVPRNFSYVYFPKEGAQILDAGGEQIGSLNRPVLVDDEHKEVGGFVDVGGARDARKVAWTSLTPAAPSSLHVPVGDLGLRKDIGEIRDPELSVREIDEKKIATLRLGHGAREYKFEYEISGDAVKPLRMYSKGNSLTPIGINTIIGLAIMWVSYTVISTMIQRVFPQLRSAPTGQCCATSAP
jgi:hypothetical protein